MVKKVFCYVQERENTKHIWKSPEREKETDWIWPGTVQKQKEQQGHQSER